MRVLAVDPQQVFSNNLLKGFKEEGFIIDRVLNFTKAEWLAKTVPYDIILLNIESFSFGLEIINRMVEVNSSTFLIAIISNISLEEKVLLFEKGVDDVIIYPFYFKELIVKMRRLMRKEKNVNSGSARLEIGDLQIDPDRFLVKRGSRPINLRRKEFDLLYFFYRNRGRILSKVSILEGVWDTNADIFTNTLEVHILNLRRKIDFGVPEESQLIHTIYGRGYCFGFRPSLSGETPATRVLSTN